MVLAKNIPGILKKHFQIEVKRESKIECEGYINNRLFTCLFGGCSMFYTDTLIYTTTEREPRHSFRLYIL